MRGGRHTVAPSILLAALLLSILAVAPAVTADTGTGPPARLGGGQPRHVHTVAPDPGSGHQIWPYTSRRKSFDSATLPINVVVLEDASTVRTMLTLGSDTGWVNQSRGLNGSGTSADGGEGDLVSVRVNGSGLDWREARGANRYTFVTDGDGTRGHWIDETYQLHHGDYFGSRYHVRFYKVGRGNDSYTAMQVHHEHFDWFRLRHTVGSLPRAQHYVETRFYGKWYVSDVTRRRFTNGGILNSDGWATVVDFRFPKTVDFLLPLFSALVGLVAVGSVFEGGSLDRRRVERWLVAAVEEGRPLLLAVAVAIVPLFVRAGSVTVEHTGLVNDPHVIAAAFFPVLVLGTPLVAYRFARGLAPSVGFIGALSGLGLGFLVDYASLQITVLPIGVVVHRVVLLLAVGLVAAGGAGRSDEWPNWRSVLTLGACLWVAAICWSLVFT